MFEDTPHNATLKECDEEDGLDGGEEDRNPLFEEDNSHNTILLRPSTVEVQSCVIYRQIPRRIIHE
mgnify:FL=1